MSLDHYVSQVHLKNFYSPDLGGKQMHALRKKDLYGFPCSSRDVCRLNEGSTNEYLREPRKIEEFLETIEPKYNSSLEKLRLREIDQETVYVLSGFAAYIGVCSPTAMRLHAEPLRTIVDATARVLEQTGALGEVPSYFEGKSISDLLDTSEIKIKIDEKYPQAIGIASILQRASSWGNSSWEVLLNQDEKSPFFTSDFPLAIEITQDPRVLNRIIPLSPDIALRIKPDINLDRNELDLSFKKFRVSYKKISGKQVRCVNELIVRCAENLVFYRDKEEWVQRFVTKHSPYKIVAKTVRLPQGTGYGIASTMRIEKDE